MTRKQLAITYIDLLAETLAILDNYPDDDFAYVYSRPEYDEISREINNTLDEKWRGEKPSFLTFLSKYIHDLVCEEEKDRFVRAYTIANWMDEHITYLVDNDEGDISLWPICKVSDEKPFILYSLNDNVESTKIWINPRFPLRPSYDENFSFEKDPSNKNIFYKMNNVLKRCSYYRYDGRRKIKNVVISNDTLAKYAKDDSLTIAFSPITSQQNLVSSEIVPYQKDGIKYKGMRVSLHEEEEIQKRTERDWLHAGDDNIDILFMPELMGTKESCGLELADDHIEWVFELFKKVIKDEHSPILTILPSYWSENKNSSTIVSNDGAILGVQRKYEPYVRDEKNKLGPAIEALESCDEKETIVFHIPHVHRIAVIICSEFLVDNRAHWSSILCACLGVSLLIVPSYSGGETDFLNKLPAYKEYGTTVIWGNCCGAVCSNIDYKQRCIGGCGNAGEKVVSTFGKTCKCDHECSGIETCAFVVSIPLHLRIEKNGSLGGSQIIHSCGRTL